MGSLDQSNEQFRAEFRATIPRGYSGIRHAAIIAGFGILVIGACAWLISPPLGWADLAMIPLVVIGWNLLEWWGHKMLHRPGKSALSRALYTRHTLTHHRFFTEEHGVLEGPRDLKIVFFPAFALPLITLMALVPAAVVWLAISLNAGLVFLISTVAMYLLFEAFHLCAHLPDTHWITRIPLVDTMRRHHLAHHDPSLMMTHNMNFTLPWADWFFETSDVRRGFWGTTFNGASTRHVRRPDAGR